MLDYLKLKQLRVGPLATAIIEIDGRLVTARNAPLGQAGAEDPNATRYGDGLHQ